MKKYEQEFQKTHKLAYPSTLMKTEGKRDEAALLQEVQYFSGIEEDYKLSTSQDCEGSQQWMDRSSQMDKEWNEELLKDGVDYRQEMNELIENRDTSLNKIVDLMCLGFNKFQQQQNQKTVEQQNNDQIDEQINQQIGILNIADVEETEEDKMNNFIAYQRESIKNQDCQNLFDLFINKTRREFGYSENYKKFIQQISIQLSEYKEGNRTRITEDNIMTSDNFFQQNEFKELLEEAQKQNNRLRIELYRKDKQIEQLNLQLKQRESIYEELKNNYDKCIKTYGQEKQQLNNEVNELKGKNREKGQEMQEIRVALQMKIDEVKEKEQQVKMMESSLSYDKQLVQQNEVLRQRIRDLESQNQNKDRQKLELDIQMQKLQREKEVVDNQLYDAQQSYGVRQVNLTALKTKLSELEEELQQEIEVKQELASKYDKLKGEKRELEVNLQQIGSEFRKIRDNDNISYQQQKVVQCTQFVDQKQEREQKLLFDKQMQGFKKVRNQQIKQYLSQTHVNIQNQVNWFQCMVIMVACGSLQICWNMMTK